MYEDNEDNFARGLLVGLALSALFYGAVAYLIWGR